MRFAIEWTSLIPYGSGGPRRLGARLPLHRAVVPQDRRVLEGPAPGPPVPRLDRVLLRLRQLRRDPDPAPRVRGGGHRAASRDAGQPRRHADPALPPGGRARLRLDGQPALPGEDRLASTIPATRPVDIRLLVQPEHEHLSRRYLESTKTALRAYGAWSAPYPYPQITVVDPAWNSSSGGMEYPTLFTGGARYFAPEALQSPEGVTVHEAGHQFWYGLVGNNEFEEAWLDEGFNSYHEEKADWLWLGPVGLRPLLLRPLGRPGQPHRLALRRPRRPLRPRGDQPPRAADHREDRRHGPAGLGVPHRGTPTASTRTASRPSACRPWRGSWATRP